MNFSTSKSVPSVLSVALLATFALVVFAAEPEPVAPVDAGKVASENDVEPQVGRSSVNSLEVNQAELEGNGGFFLPDAATLKPMTMEINTVLDLARVEVAALQERFDNESNDNAALALSVQIEQIKINTELDILRVQKRYAEAAGNTELATELEEALTSMTSPRPRVQPVDRPAPSASVR